MATSPLGRNIRAAREQRGWSRATLAAKSGVSEPTIARIELYGHEPRVANLVALSRVLAVDLDDLMRPPLRRGPRQTAS